MIITTYFPYNNNPHPDKQAIAANLFKDQQKFTVRAAQKISQELVNEFIESWKDIFFKGGSLSSDMDANEIQLKCKEMLDRQQKNLGEIYSAVRSYPFAEAIEKWQNLLNGWEEIRDVETFLKRIIADRNTAKELMDRCKQVKEFHDDQLPKYKEYLSFVHDNNLNFEELPDCEDSIAAMRTIETETWPIDKMPYYKKLRDELRFKLEELKKSLRDRIRKAYTQEVASLKMLAADNHVEYALSVDVVVMKKCQPDNILALKNNLDTSGFYSQEAAKIMEKATGAQPHPSSGSSGTPSSPVTSPKRVSRVKLNTRTVRTIKSEQDVERYLEDLRQQLMTHISNGEEFIVL